MTDAALGEHGGRHPVGMDAAEAHLGLPSGEARQRFTAAFADECDVLSRPAGQPGADATALVDAVAVLHRLARIAGSVGFPRVSTKAAELEEALTTGVLNRSALADRVPGLRAALALDI